MSKRWRIVFSFDAVTKVYLRETLAFLNMEGTDRTPTDAINYFRGRRGLQCAQPVKRIFLPWTESLEHSNWISYYSRRLFCCMADDISLRHVKMLDLETGVLSDLSQEIAQPVNWDEKEDVTLSDYTHLHVSDRYVI